MIKAKLIETEEGFYVIEGATNCSIGLNHSYFLVDTGASNSIFAADAADCIRDNSLIKELGDAISTSIGMVSLMISNVSINMRGLFVERGELPSIRGYNVSGILGSDFFLTNNIVLDFSEGELYQHQFQSMETKRNIYYSMSLGLDNYKVPVIMLESKESCFFFILDSGSNDNIISVCSLEYIQRKNEDDAGIFYIKGLTTYVSGTEYTIPFKIHSLKGEQSIIERFLCPETRLNLEKCQHALFDISGVVGTAFLRKHKIVFDYHQKLFYSNGDLDC